MNLANKITLVRIFLVPVLMFFLLSPFHLGVLPIGGQLLDIGEVGATVVFLVAACTDGLDGYIARRRQVVTRLGKFLDPLADKLLVTAALILLVEMGRLHSWMAIVIISREFAVTGLRMLAAAEGRMVAANMMGKVKMTVQIVAIASLMLNNLPFSLFGFPFATIAIHLAVLITLASGISYFYNNRELLWIVTKVR